MKKLFLNIILCLLLLCGIAYAEQNYSYSNYTYSTPKTFNYKPAETINSKEKILFILDLSNSMNEKIGGRTKLDIAISTLKDTLQMLPPHAEVGMRVYGHKTGFTPRQGCTASQLISPISENNAISIYAKLGSLNAVGWTPITYSLKQAAYFDFPHGDYKKRIILISDGGENCDESPCEYIINLMKYRDDIRIDVIALAIGDQDANNQLKCVALVTSGKFYNANTASELKNSLQDSLNLQKEVSGVILKQ